jgi:hypothetical protein
MKKAILTFGLLSLVMVLTSFTAPQTVKATINNNTTIQAAGAGSAGGTIRLDAAGAGSAGGTIRLDAAGAGSAGGTIRLDAAGAGSAGGTIRLD